MEIGISYKIYFSYTKRYFTNDRKQVGKLYLCIDDSNGKKERLEIKYNKNEGGFWFYTEGDIVERIDELFDTRDGYTIDSPEQEKYKKRDAWVRTEMEKIEKIDPDFTWDWHN